MVKESFQEIRIGRITYEGPTAVEAQPHQLVIDYRVWLFKRHLEIPWSEFAVVSAARALGRGYRGCEVTSITLEHTPSDPKQKPRLISFNSPANSPLNNEIRRMTKSPPSDVLPEESALYREAARRCLKFVPLAGIPVAVAIWAVTLLALPPLRWYLLGGLFVLYGIMGAYATQRYERITGAGKKCDGGAATNTGSTSGNQL